MALIPTLYELHQYLVDLWNYIYNTVNDAVKRLWDTFISPAVEAFKKILGDVGTTLWISISGAFNTVTSWITTSINGLWAGLNSTLQVFWAGIKSGIDDIWRIVSSIVSDVASAITNFANSLWAGLNSTFQILWASIKGGIDNIWNKLVETYNGISAFIVNIPNLAVTAFTGAFKIIMEQFGGRLEEHSPQVWVDIAPHMTSTGRGIGLVAKWIYEGVQGAWDWIITHLIWLGEQIVGVVSAGYNALKDMIVKVFSLITDGITGAMMTGSPPAELNRSISVLTDTVWNRQLDIIDSAYQSEPTSEGISNSTKTLLAALAIAATAGMMGAAALDIAHPFKDIGFKFTMREMIYWAGIPSVTAAIAVLPASIGLLTPLKYFLFEKWQPLQPEAADLIRMAVREVFIPEELERLKVPGPGNKFYGYMHKLGFNDFWADAYWASHWVRPTVSELNEALYRNIITEDTWMHEVRLNDVVPYSIPWLKQIIYSPYTRVDIRRMWDMRVVTEAEVLKNYKWLGYDEEHAQRMTLWTKIYTMETELRKRYSKGWIKEKDVRSELETAGMPADRIDEWIEKIVKADKIDRIAPERDLTKSDILRLLKIKLINRDQAKSNLISLGYDEDEANYVISSALFLPEIELKELTLSQILGAYRYEIYSEEQAITQLIDAGWSPEAIQTLIEVEKTKKTEKKLTEKMSKEKDLAKGDITMMLSSGIITESNAREMFTSLGYDETEANYIIEGINLKRELAIKNLTSAQILKAYNYNIYNRDEAKSRLLEGGWGSEAAETMLRLEDVKREDTHIEDMRQRDLTPSQIVSAISKEVIDTETGYDYLAYLGYSDWEIKVIFNLGGIK